MPPPTPSDLEQIRNADVVFGVDEDFGNRFIVWGREHLERLRVSDGENRTSLVMLYVGPKSIPMEKLLDLVVKAKGCHEFVSDPTDLDEWAEEFLRAIQEGGK